MADDVIAVSNAAADAAGIPRLLLLACGIAESNLRPNARRPSVEANDARYWPDVSMGVWQQTVRWAPEYMGGSAYPGPAEVERVGNLYYDVAHAAKIAAGNLAAKYKGHEPDGIFKALCRYNFPAGGGAAATPEVGDNYRRGISEADQMLRNMGGAAPPTPAPPAPATVTYDPDAPVDRQVDDWSCSVQSSEYLLRSIGRKPGDAWIEAQLLGAEPPIVTKQFGLMDATGQQLAAWLQREYGNEMGVRFEARHPASWEDLTALAGKQPVMLGGRTWGHWSGVRRYDDVRKVFTLANPAENWKGVGSELDRAEYDAFGWWSIVTAYLPTAAPTPTPIPPGGPLMPDSPLIAEIRQRLDELERQGEADRTRIEQLVTTLSHLCGEGETTVATALTRAIEAAQAATNSLRAHTPS